MGEGERPLADVVADLHGHLAASAGLPLSPRANKWLGEAAAVVADLEAGDPPPAVVGERLRVVRRLLAEVDETGHPDGDDHLERARALVEEGLAAAG